MSQMEESAYRNFEEPFVDKIIEDKRPSSHKKLIEETLHPRLIPRRQVQIASGSDASSGPSDSFCSPALGGPITRPLSKPNRVIIDLYLMGGCGDGIGFNQQDSNHIPDFLAARGLTDDTWRHWVDRLLREVLPAAPFCGFRGWVASAMLCLPCPVWMYQFDRLQDATSAWLADFNVSALRPLGMYAVTQTAILDTRSTDGGYHELSWLAVATTQDEAAALQAEPHIWRFLLGHDGIEPAVTAGSTEDQLTLHGFWPDHKRVV